MNAWSSVSIVLVAHIYLLHCVGIYPLESIKEKNHASPGSTNSTGSQTCSATRLAMAITELPQVRSACLTELPVPHVLLHTDLFIMSMQLAAVKTGMQWPFCYLLGILSPSSSTPWLRLKPKAKLSTISLKYLLCCQLMFSGRTASISPKDRCVHNGKSTNQFLRFCSLRNMPLAK